MLLNDCLFPRHRCIATKCIHTKKQPTKETSIYIYVCIHMEKEPTKETCLHIWKEMLKEICHATQHLSISKAQVHCKRDLYLWKETYKRDQYMPKETLTTSAMLLNICLFSRHRCIAKETYKYMKKGPTKVFSMRDMCSAKETYTYEKRPTKRNLYIRKGTHERVFDAWQVWFWCVTWHIAFNVIHRWIEKRPINKTYMYKQRRQKRPICVFETNCCLQCVTILFLTGLFYIQNRQIHALVFCQKRPVLLSKETCIYIRDPLSSLMRNKSLSDMSLFIQKRPIYVWLHT